MKKAMILCAALLAVACGKSGTTPQTAIATATPTASGGGLQKCAADAKEPSVAPGPASPQSKPTITIPDGPPPCKLVARDIVKGTGAEAKPGATVTVQYVGISWSTHKQFDASYDRGQPISFPLGQVIPGWQQGIPGMKEGGRRLLVIPSDLGYGQQGGPGIAPGETLVFVVDLIKAG